MEKVARLFIADHATRSVSNTRAIPLERSTTTFLVKRNHVREYGLTTLAPDGKKSLVAYGIPQGSLLGPVFSIIYGRTLSDASMLYFADVFFIFFLWPP